MDKRFVKLLQQAILDVMCVSEEMLKSSSRKAQICDIRKIFCYLCSEQGFSLNTIAKYINRDHSSVWNHIKDFPERIKYDKILRESFFKVKMYLENHTT